MSSFSTTARYWPRVAVIEPFIYMEIWCYQTWPRATRKGAQTARFLLGIWSWTLLKRDKEKLLINMASFLFLRRLFDHSREDAEKNSTGSNAHSCFVLLVSSLSNGKAKPCHTLRVHRDLGGLERSQENYPTCGKWLKTTALGLHSLSLTL